MCDHDNDLYVSIRRWHTTWCALGVGSLLVLTGTLLYVSLVLDLPHNGSAPRPFDTVLACAFVVSLFAAAGMRVNTGRFKDMHIKSTSA